MKPTEIRVLLLFGAPHVAPPGHLASVTASQPSPVQPKQQEGEMEKDGTCCATSPTALLTEACGQSLAVWPASVGEAEQRGLLRQEAMCWASLRSVTEEGGGMGTGVGGSPQSFSLALRAHGFMDSLAISCGLSFSSALSSPFTPSWLTFTSRPFSGLKSQIQYV